MPIFYGNYTAFYIFYMNLFGYNMSEYNETNAPRLVRLNWEAQRNREVDMLMKFSAGIAKSIGYPIGLVLQIMAVRFLVRGNSGYSRSAKNWFIVVLIADICSLLYRFYDLVAEDFQVINPHYDDDYSMYFGRHLTFFMWGLRREEDVYVQNVMCKIFFMILYFPIYLSPIALTVSSIIRSYCVKFPLKAKATLTTRVDRCLMGLTFFLSLAISVVLGSVAIESWYNTTVQFSTFNGWMVFYGHCAIPTFRYFNTNKGMLFVGVIFMLTVIFLICAFNLISAIIIIIVLFEAKKNRRSMSATDQGSDSKAEVRATAMLLGMNLTLFACFFVSRVLAVVTSLFGWRDKPVTFAVIERMASYLFNIPYYTNFLFICGLNRKFYEHFFPCLVKSYAKSATSQKSIEETKLS